MKIIVDVMSGDKSPAEVLMGCAAAVEELNAEIIAVGKETEIINLMAENEISDKNIEIFDAPDIITMEDEPTSILKEKNNTSMAVALKLLKEGKGDAVVSPGNTGALLAGGTFIVKRIKGVKRAALAPILPVKTGFTMIIDSGANVVCKPEYLDQFGLMGSVYMNKVMGIDNPKVGLANNGSEETKGNDLCLEAYPLLKDNKNINFIGNVEGRGIMMGECHVLVCDGFTGNLILKTCEGAGIFMLGLMKEIFMGNIRTKLAAFMIKKSLKRLKKRLDYNEIGGAVLMGVAKPVIKAHGSSDRRAIKNAIRQAVKVCNANVAETIEKAIADSVEE